VPAYQQATLLYFVQALAEDRARLLSFVVCGGGPTGVEVAAELHDMVFHDLKVCKAQPAVVLLCLILLICQAGPCKPCLMLALQRYLCSTAWLVKALTGATCDVRLCCWWLFGCRTPSLN
jgi:hypothetical protein